MTRRQRLRVVLLLNLALVAALMIAGVAAHSLAVMAAGGDYLLDAAGVGVALVAIRLSDRPARAARAGRPAGRLVAPASIAALVNCGWLLVLELLVSGAAVDRLVTGPPAVRGLPVLVVSGVAALVMAGCALVLRDDPGDRGERDLSVAAVLLDTVADAAAAAGVAASGAVILVTGGWYWLDPAVALAVAVVIAIHAAALIRKVVGRIRSASVAEAEGHR